MSNTDFGNPSPQFSTAEYVGRPETDHCYFCHLPVAETYYRVNEDLACSSCAETMRAERAKDTHAAFMRAILFGTGAAIVGMILYATFAITTGIIVGYVSLAVGWMVGKAMTKGSGGVGGRRYQIAALLLTYAAVSTAAVPIWMHYASIQERTKQQKLAQEQQQFEKEFGQTSQRQLEVAAPQKQVPQPSLPAAIMKLLLIGIASPLLEVWEGGPTLGWMIGIVILAVGMKIAWRLTAGKQIEIYGPFNDSAQPAE